MNSFKHSLLNGSSSGKNFSYSTETLKQSSRLIGKKSTFEVIVPKTLERGQRGLVIYPPYTLNKDGSFSTGGDLNSKTIRKFVLFWDKLDLPMNNLIEIGFNSAEFSYLESCGLVQRTSVNLLGGSSNVIETFIETHKIAFDAIDKSNPAVWSIASGEKSKVFSDNESTEGAGIMVKLFDALLIPDGNIHLSDVLEFKEKRRDELLALRHHLDDVYQKIISSPDKALAEVSEIEKLDRATANYNLAISERGFSLEKTNLQANFSVTKAVAASLAASAIGLPISAATASGVVAGLDVKIGSGLKRKRDSNTPYQYIHSINSEL